MKGFDGDYDINADLADRIYTILVEECGANPGSRDHFVACVNRTSEYRFQGNLGFGGKFWNANKRFYVTFYTEDEAPESLAMIQLADTRLAALLEHSKPPLK